MLSISQYRLFKKETKYLNSSVLILRDAISNEIGEADFCHITDSISIMINKTEEMINSYKNISELLDGTEICEQVRLLFNDILSLLKVLKYSLRAKRSKINSEDIFNCINIISRYTAKLLEYSSEIAKMQIPDNVEPLWKN